MRKIFPYILIVLIVVQLLAPFTVGVGIKNNLEVRNNKAEAVTADQYIFQTTVIENPKATDKNIWLPMGITVTAAPGATLDPKAVLVIRATLKDQEGNVVLTKKQEVDPKIIVKIQDEIIFENPQEKEIILDKFIQFTPNFKNLSSGTSYLMTVEIVDSITNVVIATLATDKSVSTNTSGDQTFKDQGEVVPLTESNSGLPDCSILPPKIGGCIAQGIYYLFFKTTSFVFGLAGKILDFTLMYSIQDSSYRSAFVVEGWGLVRDFCNMFFIFVLLYIAFGTILKLNGVKTKEMIINVVIIGLLINFSLFATQVIIDASNILTRVFYNQNTIATGPPKLDAKGNPILDPNGKPVIDNKLGDFNEIKLSEAIVSKVNPVKLISQAKEVGGIQIKGTVANENDDINKNGISTGTFIIVVLLATAVNIVGILAFLSCAIIFISRVVGLWLAMILAPLAFFSYTIPALQDMKMIGWKKWWPETLKLAFLAPVFAFFMYLIVGFMDKGLGVFEANTKTGLSFVVAIVVPFVFIMILLMKAKDIAKDMSGEMGQSITKGISAVGGLALGVAGGAALGLGAGALRGTVGRLGNKLATSEWASTHGAVGRGLGNVGKWAGSGSMDVRGVKIGGKSLADTGIKFGKEKEGGYAKHLSDKVEKRQKRAKDLEVHESEELKQNLNAVERDLQELLRTNSHELETLDKKIKVARENATDLASKARLNPAGTATDPITGATTTNKLAAISAADKLADLKGEKKARKDAGTFTDSTRTVHNFTSNTTTGTATGRSINNLEDIDIPDAHAEIEKENRDRKWAYAKAKSRWGGRANKEAAHKIRMEAKLDSGDKH